MLWWEPERVDQIGKVLGVHRIAEKYARDGFTSFGKAQALSTASFSLLEKRATETPAALLQTVRAALRKSFSAGQEQLRQDIESLVAPLEEAVKATVFVRELDKLGFVADPTAFNKKLFRLDVRDRPVSLDDAPRDTLLRVGSMALRFKTAELIVEKALSKEHRDNFHALARLRMFLLDSTRARLPKEKITEAWEKEAQFAALWAILISARWAMNGFPVLAPTHKLAASQIATSIPEDLVPDVSFPWSTFLVDVPTGLLPNTVFGEVRLVALTSLDVFDDAHLALTGEPNPKGSVDGYALAVFGRNARPHLYTFSDLKCLANLRLFVNAVPDEEGVDYEKLGVENIGKVRDHRAPTDVEGEKRALEAIGRLVLGTLIELEESKPEVSSSAGKSEAVLTDDRIKRGEKYPTAWVFKLQRDVKVDVREYVHDFITHGSGKLSVQLLVRGHRKRQAYGPKGSLRKWIHVEPYWRGPEDAPIAMRSHRVGGDEKEP